MDRHADLIAPCGMNCGTCSSYLAGTRDTRKLGVRSGPEQPLALEHRDKPGASSSRQSTMKNKGGDVKRAGVQ
jgi:hypothetical protein